MPNPKSFNEGYPLINTIFYITLFIGVIPFLVLVYKKKASFFKRPAVPFIWLTAFASCYEYIGTILLKIDTTYWFSIYDFLEFICLYFFFYKILPQKYRSALYIFLGFFGLMYILSLFNLHELFKSVAINAIPTFLLVATCSTLWFKNLFEKTPLDNVWQYSGFYFIFGFIIYYSSTFLLFLLSDFIFNSNLYFYDYWFINILAGLMLRFFLIIGAWNMNRN